MLKKILSSVIIFILLFTVFTVSIPQVKAQIGQIYEFFVPYAPVRLYDNSSDWGDSITFTAFEDGTSIGVDVNVNGTFDYEGVLARGQSANYGVIEGTYVRADKPVSIVVWHWENNYGTWDDGVMTYELLPTSMWGKDYWIPEGGTGLKVVAS